MVCVITLPRARGFGVRPSATLRSVLLQVSSLGWGLESTEASLDAGLFWAMAFLGPVHDKESGDRRAENKI